MTTTSWKAAPLAAGGWLAVAAACAAQATESKPCEAPQARQFDFWLGDWDAAWAGADGKPGRGTNRVEKILDGCVVAESFAAPDPQQPFHGRSHSVWDARAKLWRQTWVDNTGNYLDFTGGVDGDRMILRRDATLTDGRAAQQRMVFYSIESNRFDWDWEISTDGGRSWQLKWGIRYTRRDRTP